KGGEQVIKVTQRPVYNSPLKNELFAARRNCRGGAAAETVLRLPPIGGKSRAKRGDTASPKGRCLRSRQRGKPPPERC
ncbi:MAG: hypothetical protein IKR76_07685, partial [Ruminococcus sp.]|nr:hypothetical protein [Ruminococcus sp.]